MIEDGGPPRGLNPYDRQDVEPVPGVVQRSKLEALVAIGSGIRRSHVVRVVALMGTEAALAAVFAVLTARQLGPDDRGVIVIFATVGSFLMLLGSLGAATGGRMLLSQQASDYTPHRHLEITRRLCVFHVVTMVTAGWLLLAVTHAWRGWAIGGVFAAYGVAVIAIYLMSEALHGIGRHTRASASGVLLNGLLVSGTIILGAFGAVSVASVSLLMLGGAAIDVAFLAVPLACARSSHDQHRQRSAKALFLLSAPALLASLGQALTIRGDRLVLGALADSRDVGIYGTAATFAELMWLIPMGVGQIVFRQAALGNLNRVRRLQVIALVCMVAFGGIAALLAKPAVGLLLGPAYADSVPLVWVLLGAGLPMGLYHLNAPILNGSGDLRGPAVASLWSAALLFAVCFATIPSLGAYGAAIGSFSAYSVMAIVTTVRSRRMQELIGASQVRQAGSTT